MFKDATGDFRGDDGVVSGVYDAALGPAYGDGIGGADAVAGAGTGPGFVTATQKAAAVLAEIDRLLDQLPLGLGGVEALDSGVFESALRVSDRAQAVAAMAAARVDADGGWALDGSRCCAGHLARRYQVSFHRAKALCHAGALLRDVLPATAGQVLAGTIGWDIAADMVKQVTTSGPRREALEMLVQPPVAGAASAALVEDPGVSGVAEVGDSGSDSDSDELGGLVRGEVWLLGQARAMTERQFRSLVRLWAHRVDPDADERGYRAVSEREHVVLVETLDCYHLEGVLTIEHGKVLQAALKAIIGVPDAGDSRSGAQRRAHALVDLARINLEQHLLATTSGARPHLTVTVPYDTFRALAENGGEDGGQLDALAGSEPATWTEDTGPLPNSLLARLACDSTVARVVFGPAGEVINAGRTKRTITAAARAAVIARDRQCVYPRCAAPPGLCEAHHIRHWSDGGRTDLDNLALICWRHHQHVHQRQLAIKRTPGQWHFTTIDGREIQ